MHKRNEDVQLFNSKLIGINKRGAVRFPPVTMEQSKALGSETSCKKNRIWENFKCSIYWQGPWMHKAAFAFDFNSECLTLRLRDWVLPIWGRGRGSHLGKHLSDLSCLPLPLHLYLTPGMCICLSRSILTSSCKRIGTVRCNYIAASIEEKHVDALATSTADLG